MRFDQLYRMLSEIRLIDHKATVNIPYSHCICDITDYSYSGEMYHIDRTFRIVKIAQDIDDENMILKIDFYNTNVPSIRYIDFKYKKKDIYKRGDIIDTHEKYFNKRFKWYDDIPTDNMLFQLPDIYDAYNIGKSVASFGSAYIDEYFEELIKLFGVKAQKKYTFEELYNDLKCIDFEKVGGYIQINEHNSFAIMCKKCINNNTQFIIKMGINSKVLVKFDIQNTYTEIFIFDGANNIGPANSLIFDLYDAIPKLQLPRFRNVTRSKQTKFLMPQINMRNYFSDLINTTKYRIDWIAEGKDQNDDI